MSFDIDNTATYCFKGRTNLAHIGIVTYTSFCLIAVTILFDTSLGVSIGMFGLHPANIPVLMKYGQIIVMLIPR